MFSVPRDNGMVVLVEPIPDRRVELLLNNSEFENYENIQ